MTSRSSWEKVNMLRRGKSLYASGGFDCWLVPNKGSPVLDKAGNQRLRKHMNLNITRSHLIYVIVRLHGLLGERGNAASHTTPSEPLRLVTPSEPLRLASETLRLLTPSGYVMRMMKRCKISQRGCGRTWQSQLQRPKGQCG